MKKREHWEYGIVEALYMTRTNWFQLLISSIGIWCHCHISVDQSVISSSPDHSLGQMIKYFPPLQLMYRTRPPPVEEELAKVLHLLPWWPAWINLMWGSCWRGSWTWVELEGRNILKKRKHGCLLYLRGLVSGRRSRNTRMTELMKQVTWSVYIYVRVCVHYFMVFM